MRSAPVPDRAWQDAIYGVHYQSKPYNRCSILVMTYPFFFQCSCILKHKASGSLYKRLVSADW